MEGTSVIEHVPDESQEGQMVEQISWSERLERMKLALDERDRQAKLLQRRLARIEEALGLPPLA
ncbi:hypothetical protein KW568_17635 [Pseudomonas sp. HD6515]|uniref:hypothetical protein n=1 Tax=Pseudomonas sp. HD6515 TaxID=2856556 RepID=UPI00217E932E|nr:hypothetical protein [Pseudomonas sp. HD6515]UWH25737.1 hypothetical protein KW568_17635 [Pseudomonas sp. HD6515]